MDILSYSFFQNALIAWFFIAVQIGHTIANASFLGVILWLILQVSWEITAIITAIIAAIWVYFLEKTKKITSDSILEYISQISMALGIFLLSFLPGLKVDIFSFLFWNILAVNTVDIYISGILFIIIAIYFFFLWKIFSEYCLSEHFWYFQLTFENLHETVLNKWEIFLLFHQFLVLFSDYSDHITSMLLHELQLY